MENICQKPWQYIYVKAATTDYFHYPLISIIFSIIQLIVWSVKCPLQFTKAQSDILKFLVDAI